MSRTLLITGAAGFIGSNFTRYWREHHPEDAIVAFDALTYAGCLESLRDVLPSIAFVHGDIRDQHLVQAVLREHHVDTIVNFAAESHNSLAVIRPSEFFSTNVLGTLTLLEAARRVGVSRYHQVSTCEVFGDMALDDPGAFAEDAPYRPRTPYNASKAGADHAVRAYVHTYGLAATITTCSNNFGPYQFPEKVIPLFITRALRNEPLPLYASTRNRREWLHVADHCRAIDAVLCKGRSGEAYNVGSGEEADIETIADAILETLERPKSLKTIIPDRPSHDRRYLLDSRKIQRELDWRPAVDFETGLRETVAWYRAHEGWWTPLLDRLPVQEDAWREPAAPSSLPSPSRKSIAP